jgi:hypothetical protein
MMLPWNKKAARGQRDDWTTDDNKRGRGILELRAAMADSRPKQKATSDPRCCKKWLGRASHFQVMMPATVVRRVRLLIKGRLSLACL